jgi:hypothetical protein
LFAHCEVSRAATANFAVSELFESLQAGNADGRAACARAS